MLLVGPARGDGAVDQADPALDHQDRVLRVRYELRQHSLDNRHQGGHDPGDRGLRDIPQITEKLFGAILTEIQARDLHRTIQAQ